MNGNDETLHIINAAVKGTKLSPKYTCSDSGHNGHLAEHYLGLVSSGKRPASPFPRGQKGSSDSQLNATDGKLGIDTSKPNQLVHSDGRYTCLSVHVMSLHYSLRAFSWTVDSSTSCITTFDKSFFETYTPILWPA